MILLFEEDETKFDSLGLGVLRDATECTVSEGLNDQYTLSLKYPVNGQIFDKIRENRLIYCKPNPFSDPQPFRIASISRPINGIVTVDANHISYDMNGIPVSGFKGANFLDTINNIKKNCLIENKFEFINARFIDKKFYKTFQLTAPTNLKALLTATGNNSASSDESTTGSIGSVYDIEFKYDKWKVIFCSRRGSDKGVEVRYSKNRTDLTQETTTENLYSAVYPFYHKETTSTTTNTTDAGFTKVYIVGNKPYQDGWLSYSEGGEPYHPVDESGVQVATEGQYKDKIYCWNSKTSRYEEKVYNQSVTLIEGMGKDPEWIKINWSKFPVVSCNAVKDGYFKKLTDTSGWTFHKAGDVVFDGKVTDLSNISSNRIIYYSEVIPPSEASTTTETSKVINVELDEKFIKLDTDDAKARKHQYVLPLDLSSEFESEPTKEKLKQKAQQYIKKHKLGKIKKSTDVSFLDLWSITESDNLKILKSVEIGDTVGVVYSDLGVDEKLRVISTEYNAILDSYTKIELGEKKDTLSDSSISTGDNVSSLTNDTGYTDENKVSQIVAKTVTADYIQAINAKLSKAQIDQLQTERIKCTGILEASQFELDKLVAKMLVADNASISQTLSAGQIKVSGDIDIKSGQINITGDDGTVFKVDREGHVTANGLNIIGGSIEIQNGENNTSFSVNSDGYLIANGAKIYGEIIANSGSIGGCQIVDGELQVPSANIRGSIQIGNGDGQVDSVGITKIVNDTIETTDITAKNLRVKSANIDGSITIGQLDDDVKEDLNNATSNANNAASSANSAASNANSAADRVTRAESEYSTAKDAYNSAASANSEATSKLKEAETNYGSAKDAYNTAKTNSDAAASKLNDAQTSYNGAKTAYDTAKTNSETAANKLAQAEENLQNASSSYDAAKKASDDAAGKLESAQNQYQSTLNDAKTEYDKSVADAKAQYDAAAKDSQAKIDAATKKYNDSVTAAEASYNEKVADATNKYNAAETANNTAKENLADAKSKLDDATTKYGNAEQANSTAATNLRNAESKLADATTKYNSAESANSTAESNLSDAKDKLNAATTDYQNAKKDNSTATENLKNAESKYQQAIKDYNAASIDLANKLAGGQQGAAALVEERLKNAKLNGNTYIKGFRIDENGIRSFTNRDADGNPIDSYNTLTTPETNGVYLSNDGLRMGEMPSTKQDDYDGSDRLDGKLSTFFQASHSFKIKFTSGKALKPDDYFQIMFDVIGATKSFDLKFVFYNQSGSTEIARYIVHYTSDSTSYNRIKKTVSSPSSGNGVLRVPTAWNEKCYIGVGYSYDGDEAVVGNVRVFKLYPKGLIALSDGTIIGTEMHIGGATVKSGVLTVPSANITGKITADVVESNEGHIANFDIKNGKLVNGSFVELPSDSEMAALKKTRDEARNARIKALDAVNLAESALEEAKAYGEQEKSLNGTISDDTQKSIDNAKASHIAAQSEYTKAYTAYKTADNNVKNVGTAIDPADTTVDSIAAKSNISSPKAALYIGTDGIHLNQRVADSSDNITESNFKVTADGKIEADNCEINGKITSTEGQIGGLYISDKSIYYPREFSNFDKKTSYKVISNAIIGNKVFSKIGQLIQFNGETAERKIVDDEGIYIGTEGIRIGRNAKDYILNYVSKGLKYPYSFGNTKVKIDTKTGSADTIKYQWEKGHGGFRLDKYGNMYMANSSINGNFFGNVYPNTNNDPFRHIFKVIKGNEEIPDGKRGYMYIGTLTATKDNANAGAIHIKGVVGPWVGEKQVIDIVISTRGGLSVSGFVHGGTNVHNNFDIVVTDGYSMNETDIRGNSGTSSSPTYGLFLTFTNYYFISLDINSVGVMRKDSYETEFDEILKYRFDGRIFIGNDSSGFNDEGKLAPDFNGSGNINVYSILEKKMHYPGAGHDSRINGSFNILCTDSDNNLICSSLHTTSSSDRISFKTGENSENSFSIKGNNGAIYDLANIMSQAQSASSTISSMTRIYSIFSRSAYYSENDDPEPYSNIYFFSKVMNEDQWWCIGTIDSPRPRYVFASQSYDETGTANGHGSLDRSTKLQSINVNINNDGTVWIGNDGHKSKVWVMVVI